MGSPAGNLGTINVGITADQTPLVSAINQASATAAAGGQQISAAFNSTVSASQQATVSAQQFAAGIEQLTRVIREESAASDLATQRNLAMIKSLGGVGGGAQQASFSVRYLFLGLKDIAEGRTTFALAELANEMTRLGPLAIGIAGSVAAVAGTLYGISKLADYMAAAGSNTEEARKSAEKFSQTIKELDASVQTLENQRFEILFGNVATEAKKAADETNRLVRGVDQATIAMIQFQIAQVKAGNAFSLTDRLKQFGATILSGPIGGTGAAGALAAAQQTQKLLELTRDLDAAQVKQSRDAEQAAVDSLKSLQAQSRQKGGDESSVEVRRLEDDLAEFKRAQEQKKQAAEAGVRAAAEAQQLIIDGYTNEYQRAKESGELQAKAARDLANRLEEIATETANFEIAQFARIGAAKSRGQSAPKVEEIREETRARQAEAQQTAQSVFITQGSTVDLAEAKGRQALIEVQRRALEQLNETIRRQFTEIERGWDEAKARAEAYYNRVAEAQIRASEIEAEGTGNVRALQTEQQKLQIQREYGQLVLKTAADEIAEAQKIAAVDRAARNEKINGLKAALVLVPDNDEPKNIERRAELQRQIAEDQAKAANADYEAQTKINELIQQNTLQYKIQHDLANGIQDQLPQALGGGLAAGIFQHGKGTSVGQEIAQSLRNVGQQLLGNIFTQVIHQLIAELVAHAGITAALGVIFGSTGTAQVAASTAQTTATAANTAALVANTAALATSSATSGIGAAAGAAGGIAGAAGGIASGAATGFVGPLISAAGGVIGGVISAVATWIGDNKIVKAVNGTTAAVNALAAKLGPSPGAGLSANSAAGAQQQPSALQNIQTSISSVTDQLGKIPFIAGILGGFGLGGGTPVRIVGIDPGVLAGFALATSAVGFIGGLLGFADGGRPPVRVPSIVGEKGPELFVPDVPGTIFPSDSFSASAVSVPTSTNNSHFSGDLHFHAHGITNPRQHAEMAVREIPRVLRARSSKGAPYSS